MIVIDLQEVVESVVDVKPEEEKAEESRDHARPSYSPTQTGMEQSYPIPESLKSTSEEATPATLNDNVLNVQVLQEAVAGLARQPYSDDEGEQTSSSSTSSSSTSSSTSSWSKVESVDSGSDYSNIDPISDSEM